MFRTCIILGLFCLAVLTLWLTVANADQPDANGLAILPKQFELMGKDSRQQLLVTTRTDGRDVEVTPQAKFDCKPAGVVVVSDDGVVTPLKDGKATVVATVGGKTITATVEVRNAGGQSAISFENSVQPILAAAGCNAGACHGKQGGQNGFQLSLLGFDDDFDFDAITAEGRGRRIFPADPKRSLFLRKPTGELPHGGGRRLQLGGSDYRVLLRWLEAGMPRRRAEDPVVKRITVEPAELVLAPRVTHRLIVTAHYSDGRREDVTHRSAYQSNESAVVKALPAGAVQSGPLPGEAAIMARYMYNMAVCRVLIPLPDKVDADVYAKLPRKNFIDPLVWQKLRRLGITPSEPCSDSTFLRRASIDVIGRLPTPDEVREFLADKSPDKRAKLIDRLLERPEYADYWANKWADLLRPNPYRVGIKAVLNYDAWIRDVFRKNKPYDQFVRELLTAQGSTFRNGAVTLFRDRRSPDEITPMVSQLFLGIRLECAKCHHHPFEVWGQDDFYSFAAYFSRIGRKGRGLSPPISGSEEIVLTRTSGSVTHPRTGKTMTPRPLFGEAAVPEGEDDPREALARWVTSDKNPYFAQVMVNRVWADLMGRGIVEPVDDLRATNPPTNGPLLEALAEDFRKGGYDLKKLIRTITTSHVYGLSSKPSDRNVADTQNYSRHYRRRLRAEVLLDAACDVTGVPESFRHAAGLPGDGDLDHARQLAVPRYVRPARSQPGPAVRANDRIGGRANAALDELAEAAHQDHQRQRPGGQARRGRPAGGQNRGRTLSVGV